MSKYHTTKDGTSILIKDMEDSHLINTIKLWRRKAKEGITFRYGGGVCAEDIWYDEETLFGAEALEHVNYDAYVKEAKRRRLPV